MSCFEQYDIIQSHYGGEATCSAKAKCEGCNAFYGEKNPSNHTWVEATCQVPKTCSGCGATEGEKNLNNHNWGDWTKLDDDYHSRACQNSGCTQTQSERHTEKSPANCTRAAICKVCHQEYGSTNTDNHDWSDWTCREGLNHHYRQCWNNGSHVEEEEHTGGSATCSTMGNCSVCNALYNNSDAHEGEATTTYTFTDTQHTPTTTYSGCKHSVTGEPEARVATIPATCSKPAYCGICKQFFGSTDQTNHSWVAATCQRAEYCSDCQTERGEKDPTNHVGETSTKYEKTSETQHTAKITYADCGHTVDGESEAHTENTPATCTTAAYCAVCKSNYGDLDSDAHDLDSHDAQTPTCTAVGWDAYETCSRCAYTTYVEKKALGHDAVKHDAQAPTCTAIGWDAYETCSRCAYTTYVEKKALGHDIVKHDAQAPTCTAIGWDAYETCSRCDYTTYAEKSARGHWYGEWAPNADGTNSAFCLRDAYEHTVDCTQFVFALTVEDVRTEYVLCPVCGAVIDGARLLMAEASAACLTRRSPVGEVIVRTGALENGEVLLSVAFEISGEVSRPAGQVKITLPAAVLEGYALHMLSEDGTETALEVTLENGNAAFLLDFDENQTPVRVIRLVPEV